MAITALESDTVTRGCQAARRVLDLYASLHELNILYDSAGGLKATITQAELDSVTSFSGLTKTQLDDGMFALTATLKGAIDGAFTALTQLAARA